MQWHDVFIGIYLYYLMPGRIEMGVKRFLSFQWMFLHEEKP